MEGWEGGSASTGSSDNNKILLIQQNLKTKLNEGIRSYSSETELRNFLDLKLSELNQLRRTGFLDLNGCRYTVLYLPYYMTR